jgi:predicted dienelactone hydrolase
LPECSLLGKIVIGLGGEENICSDWKLWDRSDVHQALINQIVPFSDESLKRPEATSEKHIAIWTLSFKSMQTLKR